MCSLSQVHSFVQYARHGQRHNYFSVLLLWSLNGDYALLLLRGYTRFFAGVAERYFMSFLFSRTIDRVHESIQTLRWEDKSPRSSLGASFFLPLASLFLVLSLSVPEQEADRFLSHERDLSADLRWYVQVCPCRLRHRSEVGHQDAVVRDYPYSSISLSEILGRVSSINSKIVCNNIFSFISER